MDIENKKKLNNIIKLKKIFDIIMMGACELDSFIDSCEDENLQRELSRYLKFYAQTNYNFSDYLILKLTEIIKNDERKEFNELMKDF